ncbi:hypothetical protein QBC44DRAFT_94922 [Cladorrhinum sp. PSN332]|nr:hypothetical protein QBC44DRAFT_94922 [Cladorrhinum sp. PSN332]
MAIIQTIASHDPFTEPQNVRAWYLPSVPEADGIPADILKHAYDEALQFHCKAFPRNNTVTWLSSPTSIQDVMQVLVETQRRYHSKKLKRWKSVATIITWWKLMSSRMMQYEKVIDSVVSSHPEYAALVWGAMKFLLTVTLNHEELSANIARAFAEIAAVLPEAEFLAQTLYPTQRMRNTLANAYVQIIEFCIRATKWYGNVTKSMRKKVFGAVFKTWPLEFHDIRQNIEAQFRRLREQAAIAHQAETREIHIQVRDLRKIITESQQQSIHQVFDINAPHIRNNPSLVETLPFFLERVQRYLANNTFDPKSTLELALIMKARRRARGATFSSTIWASEELRNWISGADSSLLQLQGLMLRAEQSRDIASDVIQLLQATGLPVIWYLSSLSSFGRTSTSIVDIVRSFVQQAVHHDTQDKQAWRINETHFQTCKTEKDWLHLFVAVLSHFQKIIIVVDTQQEASNNLLEIVKTFWDEMKAQNIPTIVKILVLTYGTKSSAALKEFPIIPAICSDPHSARRFQGGRSRAGSSRRLPSRIQNTRAGAGRRSFRETGQGPELLKPFVTQFMEGGTDKRNQETCQ